MNTTKQGTAYRKYIIEHVNNVQLAYDQYGATLCTLLGVNKTALASKIKDHDESKFSQDEFEQYRQYFFPNDGEEKNKDLFTMGWLYHQNSNPHHPEFWMVRDGYNVKPIDMPALYVAEMLLDWVAMGYKFNDTAYEYYQREGNKKPFSDNTRKLVESVIEVLK